MPGSHTLGIQEVASLWLCWQGRAQASGEHIDPAESLRCGVNDATGQGVRGC